VAAVSFLLGVSLGEITNVEMSLAPVPKLDDAWFVRCSGETVTVHARKGEIGRAAWVRGRLIERTGSPSDAQWKVVGTALGRVLRRASANLEKGPRWRRVLASIDPRTRSILIGAVVMGCLAIGAAGLLYRMRTRPPHHVSIARYDKLAWHDVMKGGETTVPLILKDPERERGRKLCIAGTVDVIERTRVDARDVHTGTLRTTEGPQISFVALGNTGDIVVAAAVAMCGYAHGKQIVGLFDLPENR
jgi:hypothetical protein